MWHSSTVEREIDIEAEVEMEMEIEERSRSGEIKLRSSTPQLIRGRLFSQPNVKEHEEVTTPPMSRIRSEPRHHSRVDNVDTLQSPEPPRSPEALRWSGEMWRRRSRSHMPSHGKHTRDHDLDVREQALHDAEDKLAQEREELEREQIEWEHEREKLLLEIKRLRILHESRAPPPNDDIPILDEEGQEEEGQGGSSREGKERRESGGCSLCKQKDETIKQLEWELKRIKFLHFKASSKLLGGVMHEKSREKPECNINA